MKQTRLLFIDRDGTLIQEPEDEQIDSFEKLVFTKGVFRNLAFIAQHTRCAGMERERYGHWNNVYAYAWCRW